MTRIEELLAQERKLLKQTEEMTLRQVIGSFLQKDESSSEEEKLASEKTAEMIIESARVYTENRDKALSTGIITEYKDIVRSQLSEMSQEEAAQYLSKLHVLCRRRDQEVLPDAESVENERLGLMAELAGLEPQKQIDHLMDMLDLEGCDRFTPSWETVQKHLEGAKEIVSLMEEAPVGCDTCLTWEQAAIRGAVVYKELMKTGNAVPGCAALVTGQVAKLSDELLVSAQNQAGLITDEEARTVLGSVGNGWAWLLFIVLWVALFGLSMEIPFRLWALSSGGFLASIIALVAVVACLYVLGEKTEDLLTGSLDFVLNLKRLWNETVGSGFPALKITNNVSFCWS